MAIHGASAGCETATAECPAASSGAVSAAGIESSDDAAEAERSAVQSAAIWVAGTECLAGDVTSSSTTALSKSLDTDVEVPDGSPAAILSCTSSCKLTVLGKSHEDRLAMLL